MPSELRYAEIVKVFQLHGWWLLRVRGSNHVFTNGSRIYPVPVHRGKVKYVYYKQIEKLFPQAGQNPGDPSV